MFGKRTKKKRKHRVPAWVGLFSYASQRPRKKARELDDKAERAKERGRLEKAAKYRKKADSLRNYSLPVLNRFKAYVLGRPALAERVLKKDELSDAKTKAGIMEIANLPFISGKEILKENFPFADRKGLKKMPKIRILSTAVVKDLRRLLKAADTRERSTETGELIEGFLKEKRSIARLAAKEPELASLVMKGLFEVMGVGSSSMKLAKDVIEEAIRSDGAIMTATNQTLPGKNLELTLSREKNGRWKMKRIVRDK